MTTTTYATALNPPTVGAPYVSLLATCDPTLSGLLTAFQTVINAKLTAAWAAATQDWGELAAYGQVPCKEAYGHILDPEVALRTWTWPCLALWRESETWEQRTAVYDHATVKLSGLYVMPPMTVEYLARLGHVRPAVVRCLRDYIERHGDGTDFLSTLGIEELWLTEVQYGDFQNLDTTLAHPVCAMTFVLKERRMPNTTGLGTASMVADIDLQDEAGGSQVAGFVEISEP